MWRRLRVGEGGERDESERKGKLWFLVGGKGGNFTFCVHYGEITNTLNAQSRRRRRRVVVYRTVSLMGGKKVNWITMKKEELDGMGLLVGEKKKKPPYLWVVVFCFYYYYEE